MFWKLPICRTQRINFICHHATRRISHEKKFIFIRHGKTEMNEKLDITPWYSKNFMDHQLWDTKLTETGVTQAISCRESVWSDDQLNLSKIHEANLLISSPLSRAIHTADLIFHDSVSRVPSDVPRIVHPLLRERMYLSSEVGRLRTELEQEFHRWDFSLLPENHPWWYIAPFADNSAHFNADESHTCKFLSQNKICVEQLKNIKYYDLSWDTVGCISENDHQLIAEYEMALRDPYVEWRPHGTYCGPGEPARVFAARMKLLRRWLLRRPENLIVVVAHWGVFKALTGEDFPNAEARLVTADKLLEEPYVVDW